MIQGDFDILIGIGDGGVTDVDKRRLSGVGCVDTVAFSIEEKGRRIPGRSLG